MTRKNRNSKYRVKVDTLLRAERERDEQRAQKRARKERKQPGYVGTAELAAGGSRKRKLNDVSMVTQEEAETLASAEAQRVRSAIARSLSLSLADSYPRRRPRFGVEGGQS